jgi:hypothetical protein
MLNVKKMESHCGDEISRTIERAINLADGDIVAFEFNGVTVQVCDTSKPSLVLRDFHRAMSGYLGKNPTIGPDYLLRLTPEQEQSDARIEASNEARRQKLIDEMNARDEVKKLELAAALADAGPIELVDDAKCKHLVELNSSDSYSKRIMEYAETWARLMQAQINDGAALSDIADTASHLADTDGITGFMYGAAVSSLAQCWIHGDELRQWHNKSYGHSGDGVVNPAVLTIG